MSTLPTKTTAPISSAIRAKTCPLSGLRSRRRPSAPVSKTERGASTPPTPSGTTIQNTAYSSAPRPSAKNRPRKTNRTQATGSPRCPASPRATPPSIRPSALRYSLRSGGSSGSAREGACGSGRGGWHAPIVTRRGGRRHQGRPPLDPETAGRAATRGPPFRVRRGQYQGSARVGAGAAGAHGPSPWSHDRSPGRRPRRRAARRTRSAAAAQLAAESGGRGVRRARPVLRHGPGDLPDRARCPRR